MSDLEYDVLDELYFMVQYDDLSRNVGLIDTELKPILIKLFDKGWIKCFEEPDVEVDSKQVDLEVSFRKYYYLATKSGLKAHTS